MRRSTAGGRRWRELNEGLILEMYPDLDSHKVGGIMAEAGTSRTRAQRFVELHLRAWELTFAVLAISSVLIGLTADEGSEGGSWIGIEWALTGVFAAEYIFRVWAAPSRWDYIKSNPLDLVSIIPPVRGARLLRLVRLLRVASDLGSVLETSQWKKRTIVIGRIALVWVAVLIISALGLYWAEQGENDKILNLGDAAWWAIATMTTVGYGDVYPITGEGRIAAGILMVLGIAFFSFLTATLTASIASDEAPPTTEALSTRLENIAALERSGTITSREAAAQRERVLKEL